VWELQQSASSASSSSSPARSYFRRLGSAACSLILGSTLLYLSMPVVRNLLQLDGRQAMNTSFGHWKLLNSYGAFGSITKQRTEVILEAGIGPY
jgi:hypothetical protein